MAEKITIPTRDELVRRYERDYLIRLPDAKVGEGTQPGVDARLLADQLLPIYAEAQRIGGTQNLENLSGTDLEDEAEDLGLPRRLPPAGASGAVTVTTSAGGALILAGQKLVNKTSGKRYQCTATKLYADGDVVPIAGVDTGPDTNVPAGVILDWSSPPPGLSSVATVFEQSDGTGLTGGRLEETDPEIRDRIRSERASPAVAGNSADYRSAALKTPNIGMQAAFTYPAALGPGTVGLAFTMRPATSGASRKPNATQIAAVYAHVRGKMPKDDSVFVYALLPDTVDLDLRVRWKRGAAGWKDATPWPTYDATDPVYVAASPTPTPTTFRLASTDDTTTAPSPGKTIAFYDVANRVFVRKTIKTVTTPTPGTAAWDIVVDDTFVSSDVSFAPPSGAHPMPWSDSLAALLPPLLAEFDRLGPSDAISFDTGGLRGRREPTGYEAYPYELSGRFLAPIYALPVIDDAQAASPSLPRTTTPAVPGVAAYITELGAFRVYPL